MVFFIGVYAECILDQLSPRSAGSCKTKGKKKEGWGELQFAHPNRQRFRRSLENPAIPPSLWNLFGGNNLSGISRNRAGGIRTHDLLNPIQAHYQAVLQPVLEQKSIGFRGAWCKKNELGYIATRCTKNTGWSGASEETSLQTSLGFSNPFPEFLIYLLCLL